PAKLPIAESRACRFDQGIPPQRRTPNAWPRGCTFEAETSLRRSQPLECVVDPEHRPSRRASSVSTVVRSKKELRVVSKTPRGGVPIPRVDLDRSRIAALEGARP